MYAPAFPIPTTMTWYDFENVRKGSRIVNFFVDSSVKIAIKLGFLEATVFV